MVTYPARFEPDRKAGGFVVTFPDFRYGATQGDTLEEATEMAQDLLEGLISNLIEKGEALPKSSKRRRRLYRLVPLRIGIP
jgi:antitoxin HicB